MMPLHVVIDPNVLVSALWTPSGKASYIVGQVLAGHLSICHDSRIIEEYREVLSRPKFKFSKWQINFLLDTMIKDGISVVPSPISDVILIDEDDRAFLEVARFCHAYLITGNPKHYPDGDNHIKSISDFFEILALS